MYLVLDSYSLAEPRVQGRVPVLITDDPHLALRVAREAAVGLYTERVFICELLPGEIYSVKDFYGFSDPDDGPSAKIIVATLWRHGPNVFEEFFHGFDQRAQVQSVLF